EEQLVTQARAATGLHGDAEREVVATFLLEEALHLGSSDRAQVDLVGAALFGGLDLVGHLNSHVWHVVVTDLHGLTTLVIPRPTSCGPLARRGRPGPPADRRRNAPPPPSPPSSRPRPSRGPASPASPRGPDRRG